MKKIRSIWRDFYKIVLSVVVALFGGSLIHRWYKAVFKYEPDLPRVCLEELQRSDMLWWYSIFLTWVVFGLGWVAKQYWVSKEKGKDRN